MARKLSVELQEELRDISGEVLVTRYQCSVKDRSLCDTLQPIGFDVMFSVKNVSLLKKPKRPKNISVSSLIS